jgi:hypothetical protein
LLCGTLPSKSGTWDSGQAYQIDLLIVRTVSTSVAEPKPHHFGVAGSRAVTQCCSYGSGSKPDTQQL